MKLELMLILMKQLHLLPVYFYSDLEMIEHNEFTYPGSAKLVAQDIAPNYPHTNPQPGQGGNAGAGWYSDLVHIMHQ